MILRIDGKPVRNKQDVTASIVRHKVGDTILLHIHRPGEISERDISLIIQEHPESVPLTP